VFARDPGSWVKAGMTAFEKRSFIKKGKCARMPESALALWVVSASVELTSSLKLNIYKNFVIPEPIRYPGSLASLCVC
ncbi:MAG: hypothetical protein AAGD28_13645, partial [Bacteroidota bacterium]